MSLEGISGLAKLEELYVQRNKLVSWREDEQFRNTMHFIYFSCTCTIYNMYHI